MGVPGLAKRLEPYAVRYTSEDLRGRNAIIDGPALAYDAYRVAAAAAATWSHIPTYADINAEAIRWLKSLESIDIKVSAILFDGALPTSKEDERVLRLHQNIKKVANFRANYPTAACPIPGQLNSIAYALLAPALREALCRSDFAQVTQMVHGEADDWCASCASDDPHSIIFTSDTDLVLYRYHPEGLVVFFKDVSLLPHPEFKAYSPAAICQRLKLSSLIPLAYAITQEPWKGMGENIQGAQNCSLESEEYLDFSKRYLTTAQAAPYVPDRPEMHAALQNLDVRVSEFVHQALDTPFVPIVYLPFLLEDLNQASAWNLGQDLRVLAYTLLSPHRATIQEYKRKAQSINIQEQTLYSPEKVQSMAAELLASLSAWTQWITSIKLLRRFAWPLFSLSLILAHLRPIPKLSELARVINAHFDNTWDFVHLTARLHAIMYSLRLLKQCIGVWLAIDQDKPAEELYDTILRLSQALESLPTIDLLYMIPGQPMKEALTDDGTLQKALTDLYVTAGVEIPVEHISKKQRKKERRARERVERKSQLQQGSIKKPASNVFNVFDVLDRRTLS